MNTTRILSVTPGNVTDVGVYCLKNPKHPGFQKKVEWYARWYEHGHRMKILANAKGEQLGFIEYSPSEFAWRPVEAKNYLFIQCIFIYPRKNAGIGNGSRLIQHCEQEARATNKNGLMVMSSEGVWLAGRPLFEKNGFEKIKEKGRFELLVKKIDPEAPDPRFIDWEANLPRYRGWNLLYADQCPMHEKAAVDLQSTAREFGVDLQITKLNTPSEIRKAPSGFGVFSLVKDGVLLEDHYISQTRFRNILKKETA
jgi:GNAT superfamily N-acetyltransferase